LSTLNYLKFIDKIIILNYTVIKEGALMKMSEAHKELINRLKDTFFDLVDIHTNVTHLNQESSEYQAKLREFNYIQNQIFTFKNIWDELDRENE
jgi:type IV secretory pathway VirB6-like protein